MISFSCDYCEGAHPEIVKRLLETNLIQTEGYGDDPYCESAKAAIRQKIGCSDCDIYFLTGGTQTNMTFIAHVLKPWQAVISADTGHIATHETGAIEASGHKVFTLPAADGKLTPDLLKQALAVHQDHHAVEPKLVYISNSTEIGTLYTKQELEQLYAFCQAHQLYLYIDGARMASALTSEANDLTFEDLPKLCDAFYLGGTKCGALFGEALVMVNTALADRFNYTLKQRGGLLAKGRLLGIQFEVLFKDDLYLELGRHANQAASRLRDAFKKAGFKMMIDSPTNQLFPIMPNTLIEKLRSHYSFRDWEPVNAHETAVRFVTSWATEDTMIDAFIRDLTALCHE